MASSITLQIKSDKSQALAQQLLQLSSTKDKQMALALVRLLRDGASHRHRMTIDIQTAAIAPVRASGTLTLVSCATDTVTIAGVTFTGSATPSGQAQFLTTGTDTADAAALTTAINAHSTLSLIVSATSALGVVTVRAHAAGTIGNLVALAETGTTITISAATLTSGAGGAGESGTSITLGLT